MSDPFQFDFTRIRIGNPKQTSVGLEIAYSYTTPAGDVLTEIHAVQIIQAGGGAGIWPGYDPSGWKVDGFISWPTGLPEGARPLYLAFKKHVSGLSAHQRLAWLAAVKDGR